MNTLSLALGAFFLGVAYIVVAVLYLTSPEKEEDEETKAKKRNRKWWRV